MVAFHANVETERDRLLGNLTDAALRVAARHGVRGTSVDQELDLWKALGGVVRKQRGSRQGNVTRARDGERCESLLAELTDAAYAVALGRGFVGSFLELELDFWTTLRRAFPKGGLPGMCGQLREARA